MRAKFGPAQYFLYFFWLQWLGRLRKIWNDRKARTTGKPESPESQNDRKARTTGKPEWPESQNDRKARTTGMPERPWKQERPGNPERSIYPECCSCNKIYFILTVATEAFVPSLHQNLLSSNSERSDLRFEAWKPVFVNRDMGVSMIDLSREIFKPRF